LAGFPIPAHLDGKSLNPVLYYPEKMVKQFSESQYPRSRETLSSARLGWSLTGS
jgi:hypothetical protein